jgi:hypothetical protein
MTHFMFQKKKKKLGRHTYDLVVLQDHACLWSQRLYVVRTDFGLVTQAIENSVDLLLQHNKAIRVFVGGASCSHSNP